MQLTERYTISRTLPTVRRTAPRYVLLRLLVRLGAHWSNGLALGMAQGFDSGMMHDYLYRNQPAGQTILGRLIDHYYLTQVGASAAQERMSITCQLLRQVIESRQARGLPTHILALATDTGRGYLECLRSLGPCAHPVTLVCQGPDARALAVGERLAQEWGLAAQVRFVHTPIPCLDTQGDPLISTVPQVVVAAGLYETMPDDAAVCHSLLAIRALLPRDGWLLFSTQIANPQQELLANVLHTGSGEPWLTGARPLVRMERWAREVGLHVVHSAREPQGIYAVTLCEA